MNELQKKLVESGLAKLPKKKQAKPRKKQPRGMKCHKCGELMEKKDGTNIVMCPSCGNYIIFNEE